ncbi:hypothetical protein [Aeromicrobium sp. CF3.5]|uniref:hypothetical protein n=1 Tax=Aeromicrobium sp. CF3.5 TaxID=3373078 RepID=UPI003EE608DC
MVAALSLGVAVGVTAVLAIDTVRFGPAVRDVLSVARAGDPLPFYTGWLTGLGVVGWISAATTGVFAGALLWRCGERRAGRALVLGGLVSAAMGADDLFMFHDGVLAERGVPEWVTLVVLGAAAALWGLTHVRVLLSGREAVLLVLAGVWFAHSLIVEVVEGLYFHEEASKAAAIVCWTVWFWVRAVRALRQVPSGVPAQLSTS